MKPQPADQAGTAILAKEPVLQVSTRDMSINFSISFLDDAYEETVVLQYSIIQFPGNLAGEFRTSCCLPQQSTGKESRKISPEPREALGA